LSHQAPFSSFPGFSAMLPAAGAASPGDSFPPSSLASAAGRFRNPSGEEPFEGWQEAIRTLDVGHMATVRDEGERASLEARERLPSLGFRERPVSGSPHDERRDLQGREAFYQNLALAEGTHQGAQHAQVSFQVAGLERQPLLFRYPLARDTSRRMREE
jgi:hypothetical protein